MEGGPAGHLSDSIQNYTMIIVLLEHIQPDNLGCNIVIGHFYNGDDW